jgi:hypothetical protein
MDHIDLSSITGVGVRAEGGNILIRGASVIESCSGGGVVHSDGYVMVHFESDKTHFEGNTGFDIKCGSSGGTFLMAGNVHVETAGTDCIRLNTGAKVTAIGNWFFHGGVNGTIDSNTSYVGINNKQYANPGSEGYDGDYDFEIHDDLRGLLKYEIINDYYSMRTVIIDDAADSDVVNSRQMGAYRTEEWRISAYMIFVAEVLPVKESFRVLVHRTEDTIEGMVIAEGGHQVEMIPINDPRIIDGAAAPGVTAVLTSTNKINERPFDSASSEDVFFAWTIPQYPADTRICFRVITVIPAATGPSNEGCVFTLKGAVVVDGASIAGALATLGTSAWVNKTEGQYNIISTDYSLPLTLTNFNPGETVMFNLSRTVGDARDTYGQDVGVVAVELRIGGTNVFNTTETAIFESAVTVVDEGSGVYSINVANRGNTSNRYLISHLRSLHV